MAGLVDLKMSKADMEEEASPTYQQSPYPYGACLNLDTDELAKLGITSKNLPKVGDEFHIVAVGKVTRVSENETEGDDYSCGVGIQITMMQLSHEDELPDEKDTPAEEEREERGAKSVLHTAYRGAK